MCSRMAPDTADLSVRLSAGQKGMVASEPPSPAPGYFREIIYFFSYLVIFPLIF